MAYSRVWTDNFPVGTDPAKLAWQHQQFTRIDIRERLQTIFTMEDFIDDPLRIQSVNLGYAVSTKGGQVRITDDTGTYRWRVGLGQAGADTEFQIVDIVNSRDTLKINATTGGATFVSTTSRYVGIQPTLITDIALGINLASDTALRLYADVGGSLHWGPGNAAQDTNLYRGGVNSLTTDGSFQALNGIYGPFGRFVGASGATNTLLLVGISGVTNGFTVTTDASNNIAYSFQTKTGATAFSIAAAGTSFFGDDLGIAGTLSVTENSAGTIATLIQNNTSNGYGLQILSEGTASTRYALRLQNLAQTVTYLTVQTETGKVGYVGINTDSPTAFLHVAGTSKFTDVATFTSDLSLFATVSIGTTTNDEWFLKTNNVARWTIKAAGHLIPFANGTYDIGSPTFQIANGYFVDVHASGSFSGNLTGNVAGNVTGALTGNASTATILQNTRQINGVNFNGSADIVVAAAAGTLTGATLAANVLASSLTSVGTLASLTVAGTAGVDSIVLNDGNVVISNGNLVITVGTFSASSFSGRLVTPSSVGIHAARGIRLGSETGGVISPGDGDVWFDGTNFRGRKGGVDMTFTLT